MHPELFRFHLGGREIPIFGYGLMMVIGFLTAAHWGKWLAKRRGLDGEAFINAALLALLSGIIGARVSHILENFGEFFRSDLLLSQNLTNMVNLQSGGLTYYGGFLLAFPTLVLYAIWKKVPLRTGMDIVAPCLMVGLAFGRIGCYLNGCCYGAACDPKAVPWAVQFPYHSNAYEEEIHKGEKLAPRELVRGLTAEGKPLLFAPREIAGDARLREIASHERSLPLHPAQLYSAFTAFLLAALLYAYFTLPHVAGRGFALMLMLEGATRFVLEMLRAEPAVLGRLSLSMVIGVGLVGLGILLWVLFGRMGPERAEATAGAA